MVSSTGLLTNRFPITTLISTSSNAGYKIQSVSTHSLNVAVASSQDSISLYAFLHVAMQEIHMEAKVNPFLNNLISGNMNCSKAYVVYLCNLYYLHHAIERAQNQMLLQGKGTAFVLPTLYRSKLLLEDIKLWSFLNPTASFFADVEIDSERFLRNVKYFVQPCVVSYVERLDALVAQNPMLAIGAIFALYGTIMSGGQYVRKGVRQAFLDRLDVKLEDDDEDVEELSQLKLDILEELVAHPENKELYADRSVSFFCLDSVQMDLSLFKKVWRNTLNETVEMLPITELERGKFKMRMGQECVATIRIVLDSISSMLEYLGKN